MTSSTLKFLLVLVISFSLPFLFHSSHYAVLSLFIFTIAMWLTEVVPLPVTSLCIPVLAVLFGILPPQKAFESFGSEILFLFLGCFFLSLSMEKYGFDRRLAYSLLGKFKNNSSLYAIHCLLAFSCFFLSMWIANIAATLIFITITLSISQSLESEAIDKTKLHNFKIRTLLSCSYASSLGGLSTPVGSPPNMIAMGYLSESHINFSFVDWMFSSLPLTLVMMFVMLLIFDFIYPIKGVRVGNLSEIVNLGQRSIGPMKKAEKQIAIIFSLAVVFWIFPSLLSEIFTSSETLKLISNRISISIVALTAGLSTFFLTVNESSRARPHLDWSEVSKIDWGAILLFGGGLTLGRVLEVSGEAKIFADYFLSLGIVNINLIILVVVIISILCSEFMSNTAATAILVPVVMSLGCVTADSQIKSLILCITMSASFGYMLPVSTPPNGAVYSTGKVSSREMIKVGVLFDLLGGLLILFYISILLKYSS